MTSSVLFKASIILFIIGSISYWSYEYIVKNKEIIIIYPDDTPTKIRPKESGGIVIANANNTIYENLRKRKTGKKIVLQPEPEKPLNITNQQTMEKEEIDRIEDIILAIREGDTINHNSSKKEEMEKVIIRNNEDKKELASEEKGVSPKTMGGVNQDNLSKVGLNIVKVTEEHKELNRKQRWRKSKNYYKIQLASVKTEIVAQQEMERIKRKYEKVFNKIPLFVKKMRSKKGNLFYSVMAGNYEDISQAKAVCKKLDNYQECLIINR